MIKTNLLPPELQKQRRGKSKKAAGPKSSGGGAYILFLLLIFLVFGAAIGGSAFMMITKLKEASEEASTQEEKADDEERRYKDRYKEYQEQLKEYREMLLKQEILDSLMPVDGLLWAEKLNMLAKLVPDQVYITDIRISESITMVETKSYQEALKDWEEASKAAKAKDEKVPPKPKVTKKPSITHRVNISAITPYDPVGMKHRDLVSEFRKNIQTYSEPDPLGDGEISFKQSFKLNTANEVSIDTPSQEVKTVDGQDVWAFTLGLSTIPITGKE